MSINRIGPSEPSSEKRNQLPDDKRFKKQMVVEKVGEIDADQKKKKKERSTPDDETTTTDNTNTSNSNTDNTDKPYSPYQPEFNFSSSKQTDIFGRNTTVSDPASTSTFGSPQPSMIPSPPSIDDDQSNTLPSSQDFYSNWQPLDNPPQLQQEFPLQQPFQQQQQMPNQQQATTPTKEEGRTFAAPLKEGEQGKKAGKDSQGKMQTSMGPSKKTKGMESAPSAAKKDEPAPKSSFPFLVDDKSSPAKGKKGAKALDESTPEEDLTLPYQQTTFQAAPSKTGKKEEKEIRSTASSMPHLSEEAKKAETKKTNPKEQQSYANPREQSFQGRPSSDKNRPASQEVKIGSHEPSFYSPISAGSKGEDKKDDKKEKGAKQDAGAIGAAASARPMPPEAAAAAGLAASQTLPYANPEVQNLFAQMVGTIIVMTNPPGISRTQVILNSPAFSGSVFQGAEITLERYSTAPDSFNVKLTGSPQAVNIFNENLQGLYNAFQKGKFNFRIGRLEASHETTKPLFRRKESAGGSGSDTRGNS